MVHEVKDGNRSLGKLVCQFRVGLLVPRVEDDRSGEFGDEFGDGGVVGKESSLDKLVGSDLGSSP